MPDAMPTPAINPAAAQDPATPPQPGTEAPKPHHSATQPRDDGKRFAGPPGTAQEQPGQEAHATPRKIAVRYKENGAERVEELTEEELVESHRRAKALAYKEKVATERFRRADELAKQSAEAQEVAKALAEGDFSKLQAYYQRNNKNPVDVLAGLLEKALDTRDMDPKEREIAEREAKLAQREAEVAQQQEERLTAEFQRQVDETREKLHATWGALLERSDLPKTEQMLETAAGIWLEALEATGGKAMPTDEQIADLTRYQLLESTSKPLLNTLSVPQFLKHFSGEGSLLARLDSEMTPEQLVEALPGLAQRFHRYLVGQARSQARGGRPSPQPQQRPAVQTQGSEDGGALDPWLHSRIKPVR